MSHRTTGRGSDLHKPWKHHTGDPAGGKAATADNPEIVGEDEPEVIDARERHRQAMAKMRTLAGLITTAYLLWQLLNDVSQNQDRPLFIATASCLMSMLAAAAVVRFFKTYGLITLLGIIQIAACIIAMIMGIVTHTHAMTFVVGGAGVIIGGLMVWASVAAAGRGRATERHEAVI